LKLVIIESPFAGDRQRNIEYAQKCMHDCLMRNEAPYASHLLYTQENVLDDDIPSERKLGIEAGFAWKHLPNVLTVFYTDLGWSSGMKLAAEYCVDNNLKFETRKLYAKENL